MKNLLKTPNLNKLRIAIAILREMGSGRGVRSCEASLANPMPGAGMDEVRSNETPGVGFAGKRSLRPLLPIQRFFLIIVVLGSGIAHILLDIYVLSDSQAVAFLPLAALLGLGAAGSMFQAGQSRANVQDTIRGNMELAKYGYSKDLEMWNRMNEYNSPASQMGRYQAAGLNPNMIYGQGTPGNAQTMPKYQAPTVDYSGRKPYLDPGTMLNAIQMHQSMQVQGAQVDNLRAQQKNTEMRTITEATRNAMTAMSIRLKEAELNKLASLTPGQKAMLDAQIKKLGAETTRTEFETKKGQTLLPYQAQVAKGQAGAAKYAVDSAFQNLINLRQQFSQMLRNQEKTEAETSGIRKQNLLKDEVLTQKQWENEWRNKGGIQPNETLIGLISKALVEAMQKAPKK